jgi:hypothetical protein
LGPYLAIVQREYQLALGSLAQGNYLTRERLVLLWAEGARTVFLCNIGSHAKLIGLDLRQRACESVEAREPLCLLALAGATT